jgi:flagellar FliJ protein
MKRFEFKLQSLLNFRKHLEQMAQQDMARAVMDVTACEKLIDSLQNTHGQWVIRLENLVEDGVGAKEFNQYHAYLGAMTQMITEEKHQETQLNKILQEKLLILKKRTIDKKAMERLREKRSKEYNLDLLAEEQKELDEISSLKTAREISNAIE